MNTLKLNLKDTNYPIKSRFGGKQIFEDLKARISSGEVDTVIFNFKDIQYLSTGFSKELFGELYGYLGDRFTSVVKFEFEGNNKNLLISSIKKGIQAVDDRKPA